MLMRELTTPGTCANNKMAQILKLGTLEGSKQFCPTYGALDDDRFSAIYQFLAAAITAESGWRPKDHTGDHGRSLGLFSISRSDAKAKKYRDGCKGIDIGNNIFDPVLNIRCGSCIALINILADKSIAVGRRGMGRYYGPWIEGHKEKFALTSALSDYCSAKAKGSTQMADSSRLHQIYANKTSPPMIRPSVEPSQPARAQREAKGTTGMMDDI